MIRIYGVGVTIAARLETLADPGGICVSKTTFDHIKTKLPLGYEFLCEHEVKNFAKSVGAYRMIMEPRVTVADPGREKRPFHSGDGNRQSMKILVTCYLTGEREMER
jgi:class 3 adenylate cyclase